LRQALYLLAGILLVSLCPVKAQTHFDKVMFYGAHAFSTGELSDFLSIGRSTVVSEDSLQFYMESLEDSLFSHDFLFARVDSFTIESQKRKILKVYVHEGSPAVLGTVLWHGDSLSVPPPIAARILTLPGRTFRWDNLAFDTRLLLDYFENSGYPFAHIEIEKLDPDPQTQTVDLWLHIMSGPGTRVEFVSFSGAHHTSEKYLLRETRLRLGESYSQRRVEAARRHLSHLEFIRRVSREKLTVNDEGKTGVRFDIEEAKSTRLDIAAGYQPAVANRSGAFSGLVNIEFLNLFGSGRKGRVYWNRPDQRIQTVEAAYEEPWILKQPVSLRFDFSQRIQDTLYVVRRVGIRAMTALSGNLSVWGTLSREEVIVDSAAARQNGLVNSGTSYIETGISLDTRDHPTNPRSGVFFSTYA
jgi:outer membrane protein assembly factor BamA